MSQERAKKQSKIFITTMAIVLIVAGLVLGIGSTRAEQSGSSPDSGSTTSRVKTLYDALSGTGTCSLGDFGTFWNRICAWAEFAPTGGTAVVGDALSGKTFYTTSRSAVTGTIPTRTLSAANDTVAAGYYAATTLSAVDSDLAAANIVDGTTIFGIDGTQLTAGPCATQQYNDDEPDGNEANSCSTVWAAASPAVTGDDNRSGRGNLDQKTGMVWSTLLKDNTSTHAVEFTDGSTPPAGQWRWSFDASGTGNVDVGNKTAVQLCSERGNGWRLPTELEYRQAYVDGIYFNLTNIVRSASEFFWTSTLRSFAPYLPYAAYPWRGGAGQQNAYASHFIRCVREP